MCSYRKDGGGMSYSKITNIDNCQPKKWMTDEAHVVYASDDRFAEILGVSMVSLFENSSDIEIVVYILDSGITATNKERIKAVCKTYKRPEPIWIEAKNISEELSINVATDRGSLSQYARLFISGSLPQDLKRVLYLDCDILINQSVSELWSMDLHGKTIGALMDAFSRAYRKNIDLKPEDIMFNSGVMLVDLDKWRKDDIEGKLLSFIKSKNGRIQQGDQGALNAVLSKETYCFEPKMNAVTIYFDFTYDEMMTYRKPPEFYTREQIEEAVSNPVIIHFTTSFLSHRPWVEGCQHKYVDEWIKYKKKSPWAEEKEWKYRNSKGLKGVYIALIKRVPRKAMIYISGLLQAYGRPFVMRFR